MHSDIDRIIISQTQLAHRVSEMAAEITRRYHEQPHPLVLVPILNGAIVFLADLMRQLPIRMRVEVVSVTSYPGRSTESRGAEIRSWLDAGADLRNRSVLIVDDILDTGNTLRLVQREMAARNVESIATAVLLRKTNKDHQGIQADFVGFDIEDEFVVGYGLDYDGQYRNLPHIAVLKPSAY